MMDIAPQKIAPTAIMLTLTTNAQIRKAIQSVLARTDVRRVVLSGFVGEGAEKLIPEPLGVQVYCWDREGATNPDAVRALLAAGAKVFFVSNLHAKVYWASGRGCVVGSANLSQNGLGDEGLCEVAVQLPARSFNMASYLRSLKTTLVDTKTLDAFELRCRLYRGRNAGKDICDIDRVQRRNRRRTLNFAQWFASDLRTEWRLEVSSEDYTDDDAKLLLSRGILDTTDADASWYWSGPRGTTTPGRWVLFVDVEDNQTDINWCCPEVQIPASKLPPALREDSAPFLAIQRAETKCFGPVPFSIDKPFRSAMNRLLKAHRLLDYDSALEVAPDGKVSTPLLRELLSHYKSEI